MRRPHRLRPRRTILCAALFALAACGVNSRTGAHHGSVNGGSDLSPSEGAGDLSFVPSNVDDGGTSGGGQMGCGELMGCYTVYAHSDHTLYLVDLPNKLLKVVGRFHAPMVNGKEDVITDLAVAPDDKVWAISNTNLYTADPNDGHVTRVGPVTTCGTQNVALSFTPDGNLYAADYKGAFCRIDTTQSPPKVTQIASSIGMGLAVSGDLVAVADGTLYGTAYSLSQSSSSSNNSLVKIDPQTGQVIEVVGATGFPKLFGAAYAQGQVYGFTHDGSGDVTTIDPKTGAGTLYNSFVDPSTNQKISFAGAGVNSMVPTGIM